MQITEKKEIVIPRDCWLDPGMATHLGTILNRIIKERNQLYQV